MMVGDIAGRLDRETAQLRARMTSLARQIATGQRAEAPGDIAPQLPRALALRAEIGRRDAYGEAIGQAQQRAAAQQTVLKRLTDLGREFAEEVAMKLDPDRPEAVGPAARRARDALTEVGQLLNTRHAGEYLFGGSDFANPPLPQGDSLASGPLAQRIATAVGTLGSAGAATVAGETLAAAKDEDAAVTPFSAFHSGTGAGTQEARRAIPAEDGVLVPYGLFPNRNAATVSDGETTGSWARDLIRGLASLAALTPAQAQGAREEFRAFVATVRDGLRSATAALGGESGALGQTEARLAATATRHDEVQTALRGQLAGIEEVDLAETLSRMQQTQTALQASYGAIARMGQLSLAQFLR